MLTGMKANIEGGYRGYRKDVHILKLIVKLSRDTAGWRSSRGAAGGKNYAHACLMRAFEDSICNQYDSKVSPTSEFVGHQARQATQERG